jgi:hypothetical protein
MATYKSEGLTESERYLANLCEKSFLSLWSYPNVFRDQGRNEGKGDGKELCDLLVVFDRDVIIFHVNGDCPDFRSTKMGLSPSATRHYPGVGQNRQDQFDRPNWRGWLLLRQYAPEPGV